MEPLDSLLLQGRRSLNCVVNIGMNSDCESQPIGTMKSAFGTDCKINLLDLGIICVSGKDAGQFLQGQLTCDVREVNAEQSRLGAHCDVKGRIQATFRLFFYKDAYYLLLPKTVIPHLLQCLKKYAVFSAVNLIDVSQHCKIIGVIGSLRTLKDQGYIRLAITDTVPRFILLTMPYDASLSFIDSTGSTGPINRWHLLDILAGIPTIYPETIGQFTPHQLNYPVLSGVSFNKGCYIGQEIIARTHYLGKSKSRLYRLAFQSNRPFPPGTRLQNDEGSTQGRVIMVANEEDTYFQALACLQTQAISHNIYLEGPQGPVVKILALS